MNFIVYGHHFSSLPFLFDVARVKLLRSASFFTQVSVDCGGILWLITKKTDKHNRDLIFIQNETTRQVRKCYLNTLLTGSVMDQSVCLVGWLVDQTTCHEGRTRQARTRRVLDQGSSNSAGSHGDVLRE